MTKIMESRYFSHFSTIKKNKPNFYLWLISSIGLGLSSVWLPTIIGLFIDENLFTRVMGDNPFVLFSMLFLVESVLASINIVGMNSNIFATSIRGISIILIVGYLFLLSGLSIVKYTNDVTITIGIQFLLLIVAILLGIYVYGFRGTEWEKSVSDVKEEQDNTISIVAQRAVDIDGDGSGVKL